MNERRRNIHLWECSGKKLTSMIMIRMLHSGRGRKKRWSFVRKQSMRLIHTLRCLKSDRTALMFWTSWTTLLSVSRLRKSRTWWTKLFLIVSLSRCSRLEVSQRFNPPRSKERLTKRVNTRFSKLRSIRRKAITKCSFSTYRKKFKIR